MYASDGLSSSNLYYELDMKLTNEKCFTFCSALNYQYAGTVAGYLLKYKYVF